MKWIVFLALVFVGSAVPAVAHQKLERSAPADGAQVSGLLREIRLTFSEAPELSFTRIRLLNASNQEILLSPVRLVSDTANQVVADVMSPLPSGSYTVEWQAAGRDGHPVRGRFSFSILAPARSADTAGPAPASHHPEDVVGSNPRFDAESPFFVIIRAFTYLALLATIGAVVFHRFVLGKMRRAGGIVSTALIADASRRAAQVGLAAAILLLIMAAVRLYAQSYAMHGADESLNVSFIGSMLARTVWGWGWLIQALGAVTLAAGFHAARKGSTGGWTLAAIGAITAAVSPALSGHAAAVPRFASLAIVSDTIHVLGASGWLGTLLVLVVAGIPASMRLAPEDRHAGVAGLVNAFSPVALTFAGLGALTGLMAAWIHLDVIPDLWRSSYGRVLLLKAALLSGVALTGAYNWRYVRPRLGDEIGSRRIHRSARVELAIAGLVILITSVLVATPPPDPLVLPDVTTITHSRE